MAPGAPRGSTKKGGFICSCLVSAHNYRDCCHKQSAQDTNCADSHACTEDTVS